MQEERDYAEYGFDSDIQEHKGFAIGDQVEIIGDEEDTYIGVEGTILGFMDLPAAPDPDVALSFGHDPRARIAVFVLFDDTTEPVEVKPEHMEVV